LRLVDFRAIRRLLATTAFDRNDDAFRPTKHKTTFAR
jgi:hypothetical protein